MKNCLRLGNDTFMSLHAHRLNSDIKAPQIRLIDADGEMVGVVKRQEAMLLAEEHELDLVEIQPNAEPPVCRIMDYGKFRYEQEKKANEAKKKQKQSDTKEIQFRPVIDDHDYQTKINHIKEFLDDGHKVRVVVRMKGRERMNSELGRNMAQRLTNDLNEFAQMDDKATKTQDGQYLIMAYPPTNKPVKKVKP